MCNCPDIAHTNRTASSSINACEAVNVDILQLFLDQIECGLMVNNPEKYGTSFLKLRNCRDLLINWKAAKLKDPATCEYYEYLPLIQQQVNLLMTHNIIC